LLESDEFELVASILSVDLDSFNGDALAGPTQFVSATICDLGVVFLRWITRKGRTPAPQDIENVREMGIVFEELIEICQLNRMEFDEATKPKFHDLIDRVFKLVPCTVMGSFTAKMKLLLFLFHSQPCPSVS
jgi:hypothetical protein